MTHGAQPRRPWHAGSCCVCRLPSRAALLRMPSPSHPQPAPLPRSLHWPPQQRLQRRPQRPLTRLDQRPAALAPAQTPRWQRRLTVSCTRTKRSRPADANKVGCAGCAASARTLPPAPRSPWPVACVATSSASIVPVPLAAHTRPGDAADSAVTRALPHAMSSCGRRPTAVLYSHSLCLAVPAMSVSARALPSSPPAAASETEALPRAAAAWSGFRSGGRNASAVMWGRSTRPTMLGLLPFAFHTAVPLKSRRRPPQHTAQSGPRPARAGSAGVATGGTCNVQTPRRAPFKVQRPHYALFKVQRPHHAPFKHETHHEPFKQETHHARCAAARLEAAQLRPHVGRIGTVRTSMYAHQPRSRARDEATQLRARGRGSSAPHIAQTGEGCEAAPAPRLEAGAGGSVATAVPSVLLMSSTLPLCLATAINASPVGLPASTAIATTALVLLGTPLQ
eukprot:353336-Chlamydomonas_euryale.AAC.2